MRCWRTGAGWLPWRRRRGRHPSRTRRATSSTWPRNTRVGDLAEVDETLDLAGVRRAFVSNVGGAGMSAVATLLAERGHQVVGSDPAPHTPFVELLRSLDVKLHLGGAEAGL